MKETEMKIKLIASAKVMASMVEWAEDTSVAIYGCGQILLEVGLGCARVLLEAICHVASVAFDYGQMILEIGFNPLSLLEFGDHLLELCAIASNGAHARGHLCGNHMDACLG